MRPIFISLCDVNYPQESEIVIDVTKSEEYNRNSISNWYFRQFGVFPPYNYHLCFDTNFGGRCQLPCNISLKDANQVARSRLPKRHGLVVKFYICPQLGLKLKTEFDEKKVFDFESSTA